MKLKWLLMIVLCSTCTFCFSKNNPDFVKADPLQAPKAIPHRGYVPVSGGKLYYQSLGKGSPIIVIHGSPA